MLLRDATDAAMDARATLDGPAPASLPFEPNNAFRTYHNTAYPSGIFTALYGGNSSLLNYGILLYAPDALAKDGSDFARTIPPVNWRLLTRHKEIGIVDVRPRLSMDDGLKPFAKALLSAVSEGYVCAYLDEFYLKGSPTYGRWHNKHETLICGYDAPKNTLALALYGSDGRFALVEMDFGHVVASFASIKGWPRQWTFDATDRALGFCAAMKKPVYVIRAASQPQPALDWRLIARQLEDQLHSRCTYSDYIGDPMTNWFEAPGVYGLDTYGAYGQMIAQFAAGGRAVDPRATRVLWEHKVLMIERVGALRKQGCAIPEALDRPLKDAATISKALHWSLSAGARGPGRSLASKHLGELAQLRSLERDCLMAVLDCMAATGKSGNGEAGLGGPALPPAAGNA
jgi:hypothetical protein